jgi:predicted flap endonuclease-1-like 5' DNA nuclease
LAASNWLSGAVYSISVNGLILLYSQMSSTKEAFGVGSGLAEAVAPPPKIPVELAPEEGAALEEEAVTEALPEAESDAPDPSMVTGAAALTRDLSYVEGIGDVYSGKLKEAGIDTPQALLERGATPKGRKELAEATGISEHMILKWVDAVDLYRIKGLGTQYSELLEATGVSTVLELAQRNPEHLYAKIIEVNEEHRHVKHAPSQSQIENWVNQAKELPRVVSY